MITPTHQFSLKCFYSILFLSLTCIALISCGGSGSGGSKQDNSGSGPSALNTIDVPVSALIGDVEVSSDDANIFKFVFDMPIDIVSVSDMTVDLTKSLSALTVTPDVSKTFYAALDGSDTAQVYAYVATASDNEVVCDTGEQYGPFDITISDTFQPVSIDPPQATATPSTLWIINSGSFSVCLELHSPIAGNLDIGSAAVATESCNQEPMNIAGDWEGTYSCTNTCGNDGGSILLTIRQDGDRATYTDESGASYSGMVCGDTFTFDGGAETFTESGEFRLTDNINTARKTSNWKNLPQYAACSGSCIDNLTRVIIDE